MSTHSFRAFGLVLLTGLWLSAAVPAHAAKMSVGAATREVAVGQQFQVDVLLDTQDQSINAVEGTVMIPNDLLEVKGVRDGDSRVDFWIKRPDVGGSGEVSFSGITPGGYKGAGGLLFSLILEAKKEGSGAVGLTDATTLLNDGEGTKAPLTISALPFHVHPGDSTSAAPFPDVNDALPPETFTPEVAQASPLFEDKWFLAFATQDKQSGVDHYEVKETRLPLFSWLSKWVPAQSPYLLRDQELKSHVYVKAVDKAGNAKTVDVIPRNPPRWFESDVVWSILLLVFAALSVIKYFL